MTSAAEWSALLDICGSILDIGGKYTELALMRRSSNQFRADLLQQIISILPWNLANMITVKAYPKMMFNEISSMIAAYYGYPKMHFDI
jgi:hypothetical protein